MQSITQQPAVEDVRNWIASLDARDHEIQVQVEPLLKEQAANRERRRLLAELLNSFSEPVSSSKNGCEPAQRKHKSVGDGIRDDVRRVLADATDETMHINDIHAEFLRRGYFIPGQGRAANITAHLGDQGGDIVSPQRGMYGLVSVVGDVTPKSTRRRKTTKRRK